MTKDYKVISLQDIFYFSPFDARMPSDPGSKGDIYQRTQVLC